MPEQPTPDARLRTARILWAAMLASVAAYVGVLASGVVVVPSDAEPVPLVVLVGAAASCAVASFLLPAFLYRSAIARTTFAIDELPLNAAPTGYRGTAGHYLQLTAAVYDVALRLFMTSFIISLALSESVAVFGFVGVMTGHSLVHGLGFFAVSAILLALRFPTWRAVLAPVEKYTGAVVPPVPRSDR